MYGKACRRGLLGTILLVMIFASVGLTQVPPWISYQGRMTDAGGAAVDTIVDITLQIYDDETATNLLWSETHVAVPVHQGLFQLMLGDITPIPDTVFNGDLRWLGFQIDAGPLSTPLTMLGSVPYAVGAIRSMEAGFAGVASEAAWADLAGMAENVIPNSIQSDHILDSSIAFQDLGQNGASEGQVIKYLGGGWVPAEDSEGSGSGLTLPFFGGADSPDPAFMVYNHNPGGGPGLRAESQFDDGIIGYTDDSTKSGVYGYSETGVGVTGRSEGNDHGIFGWTGSLSSDHAGVHGYNAGDGPGVLAYGHGAGIHARTSSTGLAGFFEGPIVAVGSYYGDPPAGQAAHFVCDSLTDNDTGAVQITLSGQGGTGGWQASTALWIEADPDNTSGMGIWVEASAVGAEFLARSAIHSSRRGLVAYAEGGTDNVGVTTYANTNHYAPSPHQAINNTAVYARAQDGLYNYGGMFLAHDDNISAFTPQENFGLYSQAYEGDSLNCGLYTRGEDGDSAFGVWASAYDGVSSNIAVYGEADTGLHDWAGYFVGDIGVTRKVFAREYIQVGANPINPKEQSLQFSSEQSAELTTTFSGTIALDGSGSATIELPDYCEAYCGDFRYQLTPIGASMPELHVGEEVRGNRFIVSGGVPGKKVSWHLTGVRLDEYGNPTIHQVEHNEPVRPVAGSRDNLKRAVIPEESSPRK